MKKIFRKVVFVFLILETSVVKTTDASVLLQKELLKSFVEKEEQIKEDSFGTDLKCKSAMLLEATTGTVLYEKNSQKKVSPASITKIMTLILIFDALENGKIKMEDMVTTSSYAKSMGGSQVFLEEGEQQNVETLIKCIVVASGNDASVAMAEYIAGSEEVFVNKMNQRAKKIGMKHTHFKDCCGLTDSDEHYTTAEDVALMSRELITKYPQITKYSTIWMENITHKTKKGEKEFTLANTNKLLKQCTWITGLKTGSTQKAKYCLSATAKKDGIELIAVVMGADNYKLRFQEAKKMLDYGYANCQRYEAKTDKITFKVDGGKKEKVEGYIKQPFCYIFKNKEKKKQIEQKKKEIEYLKAPIYKNQKIGEVLYFIGKTQIGQKDILAKEDIEALKYKDVVKKMFGNYLLDVI